MKWLSKAKILGLLASVIALLVVHPASAEGLFKKLLGKSGPMSEQEYFQKMSAGLDLVAAQVDKSAKKGRGRLEFSANHMFAHGAFIPYFSQDVLNGYATALRQAGADRIEINLSVDPWVKGDQATIHKYDLLISHIRSLGLKLALNPEYNRGAVNYRNFAEWASHAVPVFAQIASRYKPDIFIITHEPTTMAKRMGFNASPDDWANLVAAADPEIRKASPYTQTGAGGQWYEEKYLRRFASISGLRFITINIYDLNHLKAFNSIILMAKGRGKEVYIAETWRPPYAAKGQGTLEDYISTGIGLDRYVELDKKWLQVMTDYASVWHLQSISPFWTQTFFTYVQQGGNALSPEYNKATAVAIASGQRTPMFDAYRALASQYGGGR